MQITTEDGYTLRVFSSMYIDWGLEITDKEGKEVYYSPSALSSECWGFHDNEDDPFGEREEWSQKEWEDALMDQAWDFIEAYTPCEE